MLNIMNLSRFFRIIKSELMSPLSDEKLLNIMFGCITKRLNIQTSTGEEYYCDKSMVSGILNGRRPIPAVIKEGAYNVSVIDSAKQYFYDEILFFLPESNNRLIKQLTDVINNDNSIALKDKEDFLRKAEGDDISEFLSSLFLYVLSVDNKKNTTKGHTLKKSVSSEKTDNLPYVTALYEVYGEKVHKSVSSIEMCPKYKNHFSRQQKAYFDAEAVQRSSRDSYKSEEPFDELKDEMYDGIIEAYDSDYCCGYDRLQGVLNQASQVQFDVSVLCHETEWISQSVKKGICHHLVNDDKIKSWVIIDE